jgi:sugar lactone lactonase YvrE
MVWSAVRGADGTLYLGTGHRGRLYRVDPAGKAEILLEAAEPEVFAVAVDGRGRIYAATSPNGKVYRVENGKPAEWFTPGPGYIWSLVAGRDGAIYVGTGPEGRIWRVEESGKGEVWYETGQAHVTSLAVDSEGRLLAGTEPNGILYRLQGKDRAFVLWDAAHPEIRAIVPAADGTVYAAAMGGSASKQAQSTATPAGGGQAAPVTTPTISVTVNEEVAQGGIQIPAPKPGTSPQPAPASAAPATPAPVEYTGVEKSALYRIYPDNTVETLWSSKEENAYDVAMAPGGGLWIATDGQGRVYRLDVDRKATLVAETRESEALRLLAGDAGLLVTTGNLGRVYRLGTRGEAGVYESPVHDATTVARWGRLSWTVTPCGNCELVLRTRSGNTARPDRTWSDWSAPLQDSKGSAVLSPNARFVQWKAELKGTSAASPWLDSVRLAYLPQNTTPEVKTVTVSAQTASAGAVKPASSSTGVTGSTYSVTVTDTGEAGASSSTGTPSQPITRASSEQILISWAAEDSDGDKLTYALHFRGEDERDWKLLRSDLGDQQWTLDADALADGRYFFRVTASDRGANPGDSAREGSLISAPVVVDRTPPLLRAIVSGSTVTVEAEDASSPLTRCEYSVNAGPWRALASEDGIIDSARERFIVRVEPGGDERVVVIRAVDSAGNAGLAKVVLR